MVRFCTNCGTKLGNDDLFCTNCGTKVDNPNKKPEGLFDKVKKSIQTPETEKSKFIDELFESEEVQSKINENNITSFQIFSIKNTLKKKTNFNKNEKLSRDLIKKCLDAELEKEIHKNKRNDKKNEKNEIMENNVKYVEDIIKNSNSNIKLVPFEKVYIKNIKSEGLLGSLETKLNRIAKIIINEHERIGEYDFATTLVEEGRFKSVGSGLRFARPVTKERDYMSNVFIKILENNVKIIGSEIEPLFFNPRSRRDMTIFFTDLISINYSTNFSNPDGEIILELSNQTRLKLIGYDGDKANMHKFYETLNARWEDFKTNESEANISINEKNEIDTIENEDSPADELMKYAELYEKGLLSEEEFNAMKKKLLGL